MQNFGFDRRANVVGLADAAKVDDCRGGGLRLRHEWPRLDRALLLEVLGQRLRRGR